MASVEKKTDKLDIEQRELFENAQRRIKQKKRLTTHFVFFIAGSILFIILNVVLDFGIEFKLFNTNWFVWAILIWFFFLLIHAINVFFVNKLMGKEWENKQMERLVAKQKRKIAEIQTQVDKDYPLPTTTPSSDNQNPSLNP